MVKIKSTENITYEVSQIGENRKYTAEFNCENNCLKCKTKCEMGIRMVLSIYGHEYNIAGV